MAEEAPKLSSEVDKNPIATNGTKELSEESAKYTDHGGQIHNLYIWKQVLVGLVFALYHASIGASLAYSGIILPSLTDPTTEDIYMNPKQVAIYASSISLATMLGSCLINGPILLKYGQRIVNLFAITFAIIGWGINYFAVAYWPLIVSRLILGGFISVTFTASTTYIAEIAHPPFRGRMVSMASFLLQMGTLYVYLVGNTGLEWRKVGLICGLSPLLPCFILFFVPDSPRWLALRGQPDQDIKKSIEFFRGKDFPVSSKVEDIKASVISAKNCTFLQQFKNLLEPKVFKRIILLGYIGISVNLGGFMPVTGYAASIFEMATPIVDAGMSTVFIGGIKVFGFLVYLLTVDRVGRRPLFLISLFLASISMAIIGIYFYMKYLHFDISSFY